MSSHDSNGKLGKLLKGATARPVCSRALKVAVVVGPLLIAINHGDALINGELSPLRLLKMGLTMMVPYCVSTFSSVDAIASKTRK
jgi:hypothetical protein